MQLQTKNRAFVGGFGSGKTRVGCMATTQHHIEHPRADSGYFAPTYALIRDIFYPTIEEVAFDFGMKTKVRETVHEVDFYSGRWLYGTTICRSMEDPSRIIGFNIGHALADELDTLAMNKAQLAWRKILSRMRVKEAGLRNGIDVTTTPEGFRATHKLFVANLAEKPELAKNYGLVQASTYENEANLPDDYIESLYEAYTPELREAYLNGKFVNLTSGTVYRNYDRKRCDSNEMIRGRRGEGRAYAEMAEPLLVGMDFNITKMAATVYVQRPNGWHAVAELKDVLDTPDMVKIIKERWQDKGHRIVVYPDPSGKNRETVDASRSDIALLEAARFEVRANNSNPAVKDRINATNKQFELSRLWVNARECPTVARCLEGQVYDDNGEPDKNGGFDHQNDASTYPIAYEHPIVRNTVQRLKVYGT